MGKRLIYQVDMTHGGAVSGLLPVIVIEMAEDVNIGKVTVQMGNGRQYPAYLVRGEETENKGER